MPTWRMEYEGNSYDFKPERDFSVSDWEAMESAFGVDYGGWFSFRALLYKGHHNVAKCLIWGIKRKHGLKPCPASPADITLPEGFALGEFYENITNQDADEARREAEEAEAVDPTHGFAEMES